MSSMALTDYGNLFGALEFYFKCKDKNIHPIIGSELYITSDHLKKDKKETHTYAETVVLLVQNEEGYKNLCQLSALGYQKGFYYIPRIDKNLLEKYSKGLIALSGGSVGMVHQRYKNYGAEQAIEEIQDLKRIFGDRFYLEYTKTNSSLYNNFLKQASKDTSIPIVAAGDIHYVNKKDSIYQDILVCIGNNRTLEDDQREKLDSRNFYIHSDAEMKQLFKGEEEFLERTLEVASRCKLDFKTKDSKGAPIYHLPNPRLKKSENLKTELEYLSRKGLAAHLKANFKSNPEKIKEYEDRLNTELGIIYSMGFTGYFLIVHEFVHWAKKENIPVGPGRGSGASSLVAFTLGITDLDPMPHNLLFERFLNPERISIPDFDIDFCQENRNRVIQHVQKQYGSDFVAQVITFGRLQTRAAIRDVGRVLAMPYSDVDVISKLIPERLGITIDEAVAENRSLKELKETDSQVSTLIDLAKGIEGVVRHVSIHAAGVIIADRSILNYAPLYRGAENENVIQYDLKYAKKIGLVKFDFLGLKTLTQIREALRLIESNRSKKINISEIDLEDPGIYETMNLGNTVGVFQFEGYGITDLIKKAKPSCFKDIIAINALFRPGPMDMIPDYLKHRASKTSKYIFPELEPILKETHGIIVYQEQVMLISSLIAGYSFGEADVLRRAMGEKIISEMASQKTRFLEGARKNKYDPKKSEKLFNLVAEFAKYGFNKAHAAAYCVLSAQTAWLKYHYPVEFFASLMTTALGDTEKIAKHIKSVKFHQIAINPPDINKSRYEFSVKGDEIYFALGAIKGVGQAAVEEIIAAREELESKAFTSFDHFLECIGSRKVNKKAIDSLVKAAAFDGLGYSRFQICNNFNLLLDRAEKIRRDREAGQSSLFSLGDTEEESSIQFAKDQEWSKLEELNYEKEVAGFYLSQHPLDYFKHFIRFYPTHSIQQVKDILRDIQNKNEKADNKDLKARGMEPEKIKEIKVWGMLSEMKEVTTRKGETMGFGILEDKQASIDLIVFPKSYLNVEMLLTKEEPILIEGKIKISDPDQKCIVERVTPLKQALSQFHKIEIEISENLLEDNLEGLKKVMKDNKGTISVVFKIKKKDNSYVALKSEDPKGVNLNISVLEKIQAIVPPESIHLS